MRKVFNRRRTQRFSPQDMEEAERRIKHLRFEISDLRFLIKFFSACPLRPAAVKLSTLSFIHEWINSKARTEAALRACLTFASLAT